MDDQEILDRFQGIKSQLAKERRARLHAWIPRSLVILAFSIFAVIGAQGLAVQRHQQQDRVVTSQKICESINSNRLLVSDLINAVKKQSKSPADVQIFINEFKDRLAPLDCSNPFQGADPAAATTTTTTGG